MKAERIKKAFSAFLIIIFVGISNKVAFAKKVTPYNVMKETLGNSIISEEYPKSIDVLPVETELDKDGKELVIHGGVEQLVDITLEECIRIALGNSTKIKMAMADVLASHTRIAQAWANFFPQLSWTTQASKIRQLELEDAFQEILVYNYYLLGSISLYQMLYDFGVTQNQVTIKKLNYEEYKSTLVETINEVLCNTKKAYYNLLFAYDQQKVAKESVEKYEKFYNQAKAFYEIGLNPKIDVTIAEVNLSNAKLDLIHAENQLELACAKLNKEMGVAFYLKYNIKDRLKYVPVKVTLDESIEIAKHSRPDLKTAELKVEEAKQNIKLAKKAYCPTLYTSAAYMRGGSSFNSNYGYNYGIYLNFNSINILLNQKQIKEAKILYDKEIAAATKLKSDIYFEIQEAYLNLNEKKNQVPVSFLQIKQAQENYELAFGRYRVGEGDPIELKDAQNLYKEALLNYYKILYEYNSARADLEKSIGKNLISILEN